MGLLDAPDVPDFNVPGSVTDSDKLGYSNSVVNKGDSGMASAYDRAQKQLIDPQGMLPTTDNLMRQQTSLGRTTPQAQVEAIQKHGENLFSQNIQGMALNNKLNEYTDKQNQLGKDYSLTARQNQIFEAVRLGKLQAEQAKIAARNGVLKSVFTAIGTVVGGIYGGGAGAMAGGAVGGAVGGMVSGQGMNGNEASGFGGALGGLSKRSERNEAGNGMGDFDDRMNGKV